MTTQKPYTPQRDSLPAYVCGFFQNNPTEELTLEDITEKFQASRGNIHTQLRLSVESGLLKRYTNDDGEYLYCAGPVLQKSDLLAVDTVALPPATSAPRKLRTTGSITRAFDPVSVVIEDGVPIPSLRTSCDLQPMLSKLKPGQSVQMPIELRYTLQKHITDAHKSHPARYTTRSNETAKTVRVWRTK